MNLLWRWFPASSPSHEALQQPSETLRRPDLRRRNRDCHQIPHAHQVVGGASQAKDPVDVQGPAMTYFAQQGNGLQPAKALFDAFTFLLTDSIAGVPRGSTIDGAPSRPGFVLGNMRRHPKTSAFTDKVAGIKGFVAAHRHPPLSAKVTQHLQCSIALRPSTGFPHPTVHDQAVAILH